MSRKLVLVGSEGVLYSGGQPLPGSCNLIPRLVSAGYSVLVLTNSALLSHADLASSITPPTCPVITGSTLAIAALRADSHMAVFVLGTPAFASDLRIAGLQTYRSSDHELVGQLFQLKSDVTAVLVAEDLDYNFAIASLAARYVTERHATLYCVGGDRCFPRGAYLAPGSWALARPIAMASYTKAIVVGKPNLQYVRHSIDFDQFDRIWVVGDNLETDITLARDIGGASALVMTGVTSDGDLAKSDLKPTIVTPGLLGLADQIIECDRDT
jgi:4-nitrophenyl phosphatase